ncbi:MAG: hypothetical protein QG635_394, partial [Bacteroidota bacterium]|nr:hypothetical protein [Bacteroidota bacterium]
MTLSIHYRTRHKSNRLDYYSEYVIDYNSYDYDLDDGTLPWIYEYDAIGSMTYDHVEDIHYEWSADGKMTRAYRINDNTSDFDLRLLYDARGDRIFKNHIKYDGVSAWVANITYYSREAGGKLLATYVVSSAAEYELDPGNNKIGLIPTTSSPASHPNQDEHIGTCFMTSGWNFNSTSSGGGEWYIYGSEQHGLFARAHPFTSSGSLEYDINLTYNYNPPNYRYLKLKEYDLKDHLDNVRATFSDLKLKAGVDFELDLQVVSNYYPFGMQQPGRNWVSTNGGEYWNRNAYNGMEKDDELKGKGNSYTTDFRQF